jgi:sugar O-acyltransferase (sialic acid O-acetyltransferase NeuD family)
MGGKLLLAGAGGHCKSVLDSIDSNNYDDVVTIDSEHDYQAGNYFEKGYRDAVIAIGSVGNPVKRIAEYKALKALGFGFPVVIDGTAIVSKDVVLEEGVFIGKGAIVNIGVKVGAFAIINSGAIVEHNCEIGRFVHIAPGVSMSGDVHIGDNSHIGTGASIIQGLHIGHDTIIGVGSVVVSNIGDNAKAYGVPCKVR